MCLPLSPPTHTHFSPFLPLECVCVFSGKAAVAGWRRTWWPGQEMLQQRESEVVEGVVSPLCFFASAPPSPPPVRFSFFVF